MAANRWNARAKLQGLDAKSVRLDVTDLATIAAAKDIIEKEDGKLDVLVNNAGTLRCLINPAVP